MTDVLEQIAASIGPLTTGRIASSDGKTFMDFDAMTCDPKTYETLEKQGLANGWRPQPLDAHR